MRAPATFLRAGCAVFAAVWIGPAARLTGELAAAEPFLGRAVPRDPQLGSRDGVPLHARLVSIGKAWQVQLATPDGRNVDFPPGELFSWGDYADTETGPQLLLADGSLLVADVVEMTATHVVVESPLLGNSQVDSARGTRPTATLALETLRAIVFQPPPAPLGRDRLLDSIARTAEGQDQLHLTNGDILLGALAGWSPSADDANPKGGMDRIAFRIESRGDPVLIPVDRISVFVRSVPKAPPPRDNASGGLGFSDGSWLVVDRVETDRAPMLLTLAGGVELAIPRDLLLEQVRCIRPATDVTFLSDLSPLSYKHIPFLERSWPYGTDRNVLGGRLRVGQDVHTKGLGMHSASSLAFELGGRYRRFEAELALDDHAGERGSVVFRVFLAGDTGRWSPAYESPVVRGADSPIPISIDVSEASRISLIVEFADRGDELDHANWLNARLFGSSIPTR